MFMEDHHSIAVTHLIKPVRNGHRLNPEAPTYTTDNTVEGLLTSCHCDPECNEGEAISKYVPK
jgi:hypothetical protein